MSLKHHLVVLTFLLGLAFSPTTPAMIQSNNDRASAALFDHFETVFSANADLLSGTASYGGLTRQDANSLRVPFAYLIGALNSLGTKAPSDILGNAARVMVGVRNFKAPKGLGSVRSEFCYIIVLRDPSRTDLKRYFGSPPAPAQGGGSVWTWSANLGEYGEDDRRPSSLNAAQLAEYVLIANNGAGLDAVAQSIARTQRAPDHRSHTHQQDLIGEKEFWGYRQYEHGHVSNKVAAGLEEIAPTTQALLLYVDFPAQAAVLRFYSSSVDDPTPRRFDALLPPFKFLGDKAWETTITLNGGQPAYDQMFTVMGLFGFAIYT